MLGNWEKSLLDPAGPICHEGREKRIRALGSSVGSPRPAEPLCQKSSFYKGVAFVAHSGLVGGRRHRGGHRGGQDHRWHVCAGSGSGFPDGVSLTGPWGCLLGGGWGSMICTNKLTLSVKMAGEDAYSGATSSRSSRVRAAWARGCRWAARSNATCR